MYTPAVGAGTTVPPRESSHSLWKWPEASAPGSKPAVTRKRFQKRVKIREVIRKRFQKRVKIRKEHEMGGEIDDIFVRLHNYYPCKSVHLWQKCTSLQKASSGTGVCKWEKKPLSLSLSLSVALWHTKSENLVSRSPLLRQCPARMSGTCATPPSDACAVAAASAKHRTWSGVLRPAPSDCRHQNGRRRPFSWPASAHCQPPVHGHPHQHPTTAKWRSQKVKMWKAKSQSNCSITAGKVFLPCSKKLIYI